MRVIVSLRQQYPYLTGSIPCLSLTWRLGWPHNQFERLGEGENSQPVVQITVIHSVLTEITLLEFKSKKYKHKCRRRFI